MEDFPANRPETMSMQRLGAIAHDVYGISMHGEPAEALGVDDLHAKGYSDKEILNVIRADLFRATADTLAERMQDQEFIPTSAEWLSYAGRKTYTFDKPEDLQTLDGTVCYPKLKLYLQKVVVDTAQDVWDGDYQQSHPNAAAVLNELGRDAWNEGERVELFGALELGLDIILATQKYADQYLPGDHGRTMQASMPTLYKLASQNVESTGSPDAIIGLGLDYAPDPKELLRYQEHFRASLDLYSDQQLRSLKAVVLDYYLEDELYDKREDNLPMLEDMDNVLHDRASLIEYLSGLMPEGEHAFMRQYPFDLVHVTRCASWIKDSQLMTPDIENILSDMELTMRDYVLSETYFSSGFTPNKAAPHIGFTPAEEQEPGRAKELLFREDVATLDGVIKALDLHPVEETTTRCAAMNMSISKTAQSKLQATCEKTGFAPRRMNGIDIVTLLSVRTHQQLLSGNSRA